jgi:hypothetical protein
MSPRRSVPRLRASINTCAYAGLLLSLCPFVPVWVRVACYLGLTLSAVMEEVEARRSDQADDTKRRS